MNRLPWFLAVLMALGCFLAPAVTATPASASTPTPGGQMLNWAEAHAKGHPYQTGGTGPYGYDCSGTVYAAARALGISLGGARTSYEMARGGPHLEIIPLSEARRGDILVYPGAGHVEFKTIWRNGSFGAAHHGTVVWWHTWSVYYHPVFALRVH
jgi:cell wall-associated NlpC family hydrolase